MCVQVEFLLTMKAANQDASPFDRDSPIQSLQQQRMDLSNPW